MDFDDYDYNNDNDGIDIICHSGDPCFARLSISVYLRKDERLE